MNLLLNGLLHVFDCRPGSYSDLLLLSLPYISKEDLEIRTISRLELRVIGLGHDAIISCCWKDGGSVRIVRIGKDTVF